ncbi:MAG TPA: HAMP domain-containing sensor histidine kinase [Caulobacteraceae bacterium]|jgi:signal transduction histidine kinase
MPTAARAAPPASPEEREPLSANGRRALLRTVSHELRTPLNAIIGFSDILSCELYGPLGSDQYREYAAIIRDSGHKLLKLVNDILEVARLEGGAAHLIVREEPLRQAVEEAVQACRLEAAAGDVRIVVDEPEGLPMVMGDARGLRTIFFNLFQRAVAASAPGSEIRVSAVGGCGRRRGWVHVEVRDASGPVDPALLDVMAEPFQAPDHEGSGSDLGLPIVRLLTEALGGEFELKPTSQGLCAVVRLRACEG